MVMNYIHRIFANALLLVSVLCATGCSNDLTIEDLKSGDLLFVVNGTGNNITDVTEGVDDLGIDHVAIVAGSNVIEAIPKYGVVKSPLDSFLVRLSENEGVIVGRVDGLDVEASVANAEQYLGKPYDDIFMPSDSAIYCSELVQKSYVFKEGLNQRGSKVKGEVDRMCNAFKAGEKKEAAIVNDEEKAGDVTKTGYEEKKKVSGKNNLARGDEAKAGDVVKAGDETKAGDEAINGDVANRIGTVSVFNTIPMSFHDSTGKVTEFWTKFYAARGMEVPEGEPGTNPGQLSRDPSVQILGFLTASTFRQAQ